MTAQLAVALPGNLIKPGRARATSHTFRMPFESTFLHIEPKIILTETTQENRGAVEKFIHHGFGRAYGAQLTHFMPRLFSLSNQRGEMIGAFGLRPADEPLFLECYLDSTVENMIGDFLGRPVVREQIVEVGQFAGVGAGMARIAIARLTYFLHRQGYRWVVFTGTGTLRNTFSRLGLKPVEMAVADPACLAPEERSKWGSYYENSPRVVFGDIAEGYAWMKGNGTYSKDLIREALL
jgi:hypothetical protein